MKNRWLWMGVGLAAVVVSACSGVEESPPDATGTPPLDEVTQESIDNAVEAFGEPPEGFCEPLVEAFTVAPPSATSPDQIRQAGVLLATAAESAGDSELGRASARAASFAELTAGTMGADPAAPPPPETLTDDYNAGGQAVVDLSWYAVGACGFDLSVVDLPESAELPDPLLDGLLGDPIGVQPAAPPAD